MDNSDITDPIFRQAVEAIDSGNVSLLKDLLLKYPQLICKRLDVPTEGYFKHPYLLWFIADNPIRNEKLPSNIVDVTRLLIDVLKMNAEESFQEQIDYALALVATGRIPKECGVQIELIDLLIDAGATPGNGHGALAHGNPGAAQRLIERGGKLTLATAICLDRANDIPQLAKEATAEDKQIALVAAGFFGKADMIRYLISLGTDVNAYLNQSSGFHHHATALHQAVFSGSLESVQLLVEAGASLDAEDRIYHGTPLGWAQYMQAEESNEVTKPKFAEIEAYLLSMRKDYTEATT